MKSTRPLKDAAYPQLARVGKALASPARLEILDLLAQAPRTVEAIADACGLTLANASQHLRVLRSARLVESDKRGLFVSCRLAGPDVALLVVALRRVGESRLLEIGAATRAFAAEVGDAEPVDRDTLARRVRAGEVTLLDVRPADEYRAGHLPGALSVPMPELGRRLAALPTDREIVAYCRGPWCVMAAEAVRTLREHGFRATRMEEGVADWHARGWPVEA